jgi:imidazolonepropionase-like amidohydrolase
MIADTTGISDPALARLPARLRDEWRSQLAMRSVDPDTGTDWAGIHAASLRSAREMLDAGMVVLAGTDLAIPSLVPGRSLHDELVALVSEARLTPLEALRAATSSAAVAAGLGAGAGTNAVGQAADLVLLGADPLADIAAVRTVEAVVANGRLHTRGDLDQLLSRVR